MIMIMARFASPCGPRRSRPGRTSAHLHYLSTIISIIAASDMGCQVLVSGPERRGFGKANPRLRGHRIIP
jgi:hypothetical protein